MNDPILNALLSGLASGAPEPEFKPAKMVHIRELLEATSQPKFEIGDIVVLRDWSQTFYRLPKKEDRCIVTQVLQVPFRGGEPGTIQTAKCYDIALAFLDPDEDVVEFLMDSRAFKKVGSIYDPIEVDGEKVAVE